MQDKYCGDAVCTPAIRILEEMGVLQELVAHNEANFADSGGFVSPSGLSYIGALLFKWQLAPSGLRLPAGQGLSLCKVTRAESAISCERSQGLSRMVSNQIAVP